MLSVILPSYNEEGMIKKAGKVLSELLQREKLEYELIFVNDGSRDNTWKEICELSELNDNVLGVCFAKKFWKGSSHFIGFGSSER